MSTTADTENVRSGASTEDVRRQARVVKEDLRGLGRAVKDVAQDKLEDARRRAVEYVDEGKQRTAQYYEKGKHEATRLENQVEDYIRSHPLQSVLIATGAGVVLGLLLRRR